MHDGDARSNAIESWALPVSEVRFVDARKAEALERLDIRTVEDLVRHYPFRHLDLSTTAPVSAVKPGTEATVTGVVHDIKVKHPRPRLSITEIALVDDTAAIIGVWFNQPYMGQRFQIGERLAFAGRVEFEYGLKQMRSPFVERLGEDNSPESLGRILPVHRVTDGLSTNWMRRLVDEALTIGGKVPDPLPALLRSERGLMSLRHALRSIHFPQSAEEADAARRRLAYEELLVLQLGLRMRRHREVGERPGFSHTIQGPATSRFESILPFALTDDQSRAAQEVTLDMRSTVPMNRMLLGDVGTGKTAVATAALAAAADSGTQAAMMAPTEVLATQYASKVGPLLDDMQISWRLLTGSTPATERRAILAGLMDGTVSVAFGTHALIQEDVQFKHLTLAIVDEQHRFGVSQRLALRSKGETPDLLVMTATPIPRSLALTLYGDLEISYLRTRPGGRGPDHVSTSLVPRAGRTDAYDRVRAAISNGRQAYVVCALVDESDAAQAKAANSEATRLQTEVFPDLRVGLLTGQMRPAEKLTVMQEFRDGAVDVLVATTVIEVGVDVPNATLMIVEDAERFGLAQLHQLRGRVGRGEHPGEVLLFADPRTAEGRKRMQAIVSTNDGFALAEEDLKQRGEGDLFGARQSGLPALRLASVVTDGELIEMSRHDAESIVSQDPELRSDLNALLAWEVSHVFGAGWEWVSAG
ncbi:MAG: ATP-dependent DNA helicase RecG [Coriobacteriia bacterium]|nr:ATP-dependent DNA helicase RecG [Coriobacteriia bacterium]MBN2822741.1 ATP-dependent DNA helicase RecG [Coriobacteriia bacterium]